MSNRYQLTSTKHILLLIQPIPILPSTILLVELKELKEQIKDSYGKDIIKTSASSMGTPILFMRNKDSALIMHTDYKQRNKVIVKNKYTWQKFDDSFD